MSEPAPATLVKVAFDLPPDAPTQGETLWAKPLGGGRYKLDNTPWYAKGVALDDVIRCDEQPNQLPKFQEVVERGGNRTIRVFVPEGESHGAVKKEVCDYLLGAGCAYETQGPGKGLIAVTIPRAVPWDPILEHLNQLEREKIAFWESGNF